MITLQEFCQYLNELLEVATITDQYCPNGLQVEGAASIEGIATSVTASLVAIEKAVKAGVQVLLVHHGMFWRHDSFEIIGVKRQKLRILLENNLSLVAYHLPLDVHQHYGNNWKAARDLGWDNLEPFAANNGFFLGVKGTFSPASRDTFRASLEEYYQHPAAVALGGKEQVSSAALVSGGAYRYLLEAASENVDCFVTGNFDEPAWHMAHEEKINFFALGHAATEKVGIRAIGTHLQQHFGVKNIFIDDVNPF